MCHSTRHGAGGAELPPVLQNNSKYQYTVSGYVKAVFKELIIVQFDQMDKRRRKRSKCYLTNTKIGFPGLACCYCHGRPGERERKSGILARFYFPKSFKTIRDIRTVERISSHLVSCPASPLHVKDNIMSLSKAHHLHEHNEMKTRHGGGWTSFFDAI